MKVNLRTQINDREIDLEIEPRLLLKSRLLDSNHCLFNTPLPQGVDIVFPVHRSIPRAFLASLTCSRY